MSRRERIRTFWPSAFHLKYANTSALTEIYVLPEIKLITF